MVKDYSLGFLSYCAVSAVATAVTITLTRTLILWFMHVHGYVCTHSRFETCLSWNSLLPIVCKFWEISEQLWQSLGSGFRNRRQRCWQLVALSVLFFPFLFSCLDWWHRSFIDLFKESDFGFSFIFNFLILWFLFTFFCLHQISPLVP